MQAQPLHLGGAVLFFDLAGTLVEQDATVTERVGHTLQAVGQRVERLIMVTGQPRGDYQVEAMLTLLATCRRAESAYVTRGGVRVFRNEGAFRPDTDYVCRFELDADIVDWIRSAISKVLAETAIKPLIPVSILDGVTVRINVAPEERIRLIAALRPRLVGLQVEAEGRTSVYISKKQMGKDTAVRYELGRTAADGPVYFLGNEVAQGNDRSVLGVAGVEVLAVGECGIVPPNAKCCTIAHSVEEVLNLLEASV